MRAVPGHQRHRGAATKQVATSLTQRQQHNRGTSRLRCAVVCATLACLAPAGDTAEGGCWELQGVQDAQMFCQNFLCMCEASHWACGYELQTCECQLMMQLLCVTMCASVRVQSARELCWRRSCVQLLGLLDWRAFVRTNTNETMLERDRRYFLSSLSLLLPPAPHLSSYALSPPL